MIESPVLQQLRDEWTREGERQAIIRVLIARFGEQVSALKADLDAIDNKAKLEELITLAARCRSLEAFRKGMAAQQP
jgi:hypothetical protein